MSNYCGECEHLDEETFDRDKSRRCPLQQFYVFADHPACRKFEAKKRTCGKCVEGYWHKREATGVCLEHPEVVKRMIRKWYITDEEAACDNFKGSEVRWYPD